MVAATTSPSQLVEVLEDLSTRFILNLPSSELSSIPRIIFQVEQAYWYYSDHVQPSHPTTLPTCTLKTFSALLFQVCPLLEKWEPEHEKVFVEFMKYKSRVPVCGAILIGGEAWDKVLMVRGWKGSTWGWPKGKINQNEAKHVCAAREVLEETGYDPSALLDPKHFIELTIQDQRITLFIVPNVPLSFPFLTQTRKEIGAIEWFRLKDLPGWKKRAPGSSAVDDKDRATYSRNAQGNKFYLTTPFVGQLKKWVKTHKPLASSANGPPSPPTNGLPSPTLTPAAASPPMARAEIEGPEGGTKENRISELDELFERFLKDNTAGPSAADARTSDSEDERVLASAQAPAPGSSDLEGGGGGRLNELLAGLRVREETTSTTVTTLSADSGHLVSSPAAGPTSWDHRHFSTPPLPPQNLYNHRPPPPPAQQRLDDPRLFTPSGLGPSQQHSHQHHHHFASPPSAAEASSSSHGSLPSLPQSQPQFFGIPTAPSAASQQQGGAPLSPPGDRAVKERRLLDLLESSLQASDSAAYGSPHAFHAHQPGQHEQQYQQHQPSPYAGHQYPTPPSQQPQQRRRTSLLDILVTGNGSERGMRNGLHFDQPGSPQTAGGGSRTPTSHHGRGQTTSYGQPSAAFNPQQLVQPANGFALPPPSPVAKWSNPSDAARQSQTLLAMLSSPPPPPPQAHPASHFASDHAHQPDGGFHHDASPTPPPATLSGKQQNLLDLLSPPQQRPQQVLLQQHQQHQHDFPQQQHQHQPHPTPERSQPGGERERMLLSLLGAPSSGSPGRPSPSQQQHQQQQHQQRSQQSFGPSSPAHNTHSAYGVRPLPQAQQQHQHQQQQLQQPLFAAAASPAHVGGQANGLLDLLNGPPALGRGGRIAQIDVPGYATGSPMGMPASSGLPGSLAVGRGINGLPVFGM